MGPLSCYLVNRTETFYFVVKYDLANSETMDLHLNFSTTLLTFKIQKFASRTHLRLFENKGKPLFFRDVTNQEMLTVELSSKKVVLNIDETVQLANSLEILKDDRNFKTAVNISDEKNAHGSTFIVYFQKIGVEEEQHQPGTLPPITKPPVDSGLPWWAIVLICVAGISFLIVGSILGIFIWRKL
uniref:Uncharacterized protein n=1 Tax=Panagrolaimus sp. JU765 TaxID=591449 RepID=A0AC34QUW2_9BILA